MARIGSARLFAPYAFFAVEWLGWIVLGLSSDCLLCKVWGIDGLNLQGIGPIP